MKVYIAGPMRGIPEFNFPAFDTAAERLLAEGWEVFNPADRDRREHGNDFAAGNTTGDEAQAAREHGFSLRDALGDDTRWICQHADAIYLLSGWQNSKGARAEKALAEALGLEVMYQDLADGKAADVADVATRIASAVKAATGEVRSVSSSGGEKGVKLARFDLIPSGALWQVAEVMGAGALKYADRNWERGYEWSKSKAALQRHLELWWQGEDHDVECSELAGTPIRHLANVAWHALVLIQFASEARYAEFDDRPLAPP